MKETTTTIIELDQSDIQRILVYHLQEIGKLKNNVHVDNINFSQERGQIKCTIKG